MSDVRHIKAHELKDGMKVVGFMDREVTISNVKVGRRYVNFHNDYLGINDRLELNADVPIRVKEEPEKLYLVCIGCGEACDTIETAHQHGNSDPSGSAGWCGEDGFNIMPESEAF